MAYRITDLDPETPTLAHFIEIDVGTGTTKKVSIANFFNYLNTIYSKTVQVENGELSSYVYTFDHNLNTSAPLITIIDNTGVIRNDFPTITVSTSNRVLVDFGGAITGTWTIKANK